MNRSQNPECVTGALDGMVTLLSEIVLIVPIPCPPPPLWIHPWWIFDDTFPVSITARNKTNIIILVWSKLLVWVSSPADITMLSLSAASYWFKPGRSVRTWLKNCWLYKKNQNKQNHQQHCSMWQTDHSWLYYGIYRRKKQDTTYEPWHVISNNVAFWQVETQTSLCNLLLNLETPNDVQSVAWHS